MTDGAGPDRASGLLIRHGGGAWTAPEITGYAKEGQLQEILYDHPELLPDVTVPVVACREFQSGIGPADVLVIHGDGSLVVAECKLAQNPQIRREIIGQLLDYASRLWRMPIAEFESRWIQKSGRSPFDDFGDQAAQVRDAVESALRAGRFTLLLAVDGINPDLRRIVEYLNAITRPETSVLAFEVARVADGDVEVLMPRVYGRELVLAKTSPSRQPSWSQEEFLGWLEENQYGMREAMTALLADVQAIGWKVYNGTAANSPSLILGTEIDGKGLYPVSLFTNSRGSTVQVRIYEVANLIPTPDAFIEALAAIPGADLDPEGIRTARYRRKPDLPAALFQDPAARAALITALRAVAAEAVTPTTAATVGPKGG